LVSPLHFTAFWTSPWRARKTRPSSEFERDSEHSAPGATTRLLSRRWSRKKPETNGRYWPDDSSDRGRCKLPGLCDGLAFSAPFFRGFWIAGATSATRDCCKRSKRSVLRLGV